MTAYLITVGDEILIGQITDTNSAWMAQQLNLQGIRIIGKTSVGDVHEEIVECIRYALSKADLVLMTGGLGATKDDITKKAIAAYLGVGITLHQPTLDRVTYFFKKIGREVSEMNRQGCYMPDSAIILNNERGLAPAMWFELNDERLTMNDEQKKEISSFIVHRSSSKILVSMPGVPFEMQHLMTDRVLPRLRETQPMSPIVHRTILTAGEGETMLAEKLSDFENTLPEHIKLAYLPSLGTVRLRLTARGDDEKKLISELDVFKSKMENIISYAVAGYDEDTMSIVIGKMLKEKNLTLACAESCTGGFLSHLITGVSGSSAYFNGSIIAYSNEIKNKILEVPNEILNQHGAVSEECVKEMVRGVIKKMNAHVAIAVSGIAGPTGGTPEKPVGTVWIAAGDAENILTYKIGIDRGRAKNIEFAANAGLNLLKKYLSDSK